MRAMHPIDALDLIAHEYGYDDMARDIGKAESTLRKETNRHYRDAKMGEETARLMTHKALQRGLPAAMFWLNAVNAEFGCIPLKVPDLADVGGNVVEAIVGVTGELGQFLDQVGGAIADGKVSDNELERCSKELADLVGAAQRVLALVSAKNLEGKPTHLREVAA